MSAMNVSVPHQSVKPLSSVSARFFAFFIVARSTTELHRVRWTRYVLLRDSEMEMARPDRCFRSEKGEMIQQHRGWISLKEYSQSFHLYLLRSTHAYGYKCRKRRPYTIPHHHIIYILPNDDYEASILQYGVCMYISPYVQLLSKITMVEHNTEYSKSTTLTVPHYVATHVPTLVSTKPSSVVWVLLRLLRQVHN